MTQRDRTVLMVLGIVVLLAGTWFAALKPKRDSIKQLDSQIATAQQRLDTATTTAANAQKAKDQYAADYATVAKLGKAVPVDDDTASLVYQLEHAADRAGVDFRSIQLTSSGTTTPTPANSTPSAQAAAAGAAENQSGSGSGGTSTSTDASATTPPATGAPAPATQTAAAALPPGASVGPAGFPTMPFDFTFSGRFFRLETFLDQLDRFTRTAKDGTITVRGRLLTVDGISVSTTEQDFPRMTAQIHATAYLLPEDQGLTAGATPSGPATPTATPASTTPTATGSPSSKTPVATAQVTP